MATEPVIQKPREQVYWQAPTAQREVPNSIPVLIETNRLLLRKPRSAHSQGFHNAVNETFPELQRWLVWAQRRPSPAESQRTCARMRRDFERRRALCYFCFRKDSMELIGAVGLLRIDWHVPKLELGYWQRASAARNGFMIEALAVILQLAFDYLGMQRVEIRVDQANLRSLRLASRLGFRNEGTLRNFDRDNRGALYDLCIFGMTTAEYRSLRTHSERRPAAIYPRSAKHD